MLENFKLVVFDYPKYLPKNETNRKILSDVLQTKQENFDRADTRYVPISGLDFVGTHLIIYDVKDVFNPKLALSLRNITDDRAKFHHLKMPSEDCLPFLSSEAQSQFKKFKLNKEPFAETGGLHLNKEYSLQKTGVPLIDIGLMMLANHFIKNKISHFAATTNASFKIMRWVSPMGHFEKPFLFDHPFVQHPHELILMHDFNYEWLASMHQKFFSNWQKRIEIRPENQFVKDYFLTDDELKKFVLNQTKLALTA